MNAIRIAGNANCFCLNIPENMLNIPVTASRMIVFIIFVNKDE
jgi:hypothetical protein